MPLRLPPRLERVAASAFAVFIAPVCHSNCPMLSARISSFSKSLLPNSYLFPAVSLNARLTGSRTTDNQSNNPKLWHQQRAIKVLGSREGLGRHICRYLGQLLFVSLRWIDQHPFDEHHAGRINLLGDGLAMAEIKGGGRSGCSLAQQTFAYLHTGLRQPLLNCFHAIALAVLIPWLEEWGARRQKLHPHAHRCLSRGIT